MIKLIHFRFNLIYFQIKLLHFQSRENLEVAVRKWEPLTPTSVSLLWRGVSEAWRGLLRSRAQGESLDLHPVNLQPDFHEILCAPSSKTSSNMEN